MYFRKAAPLTTTSLSTRSIVPGPNRDTSHIWALSTFLPDNRQYTQNMLSIFSLAVCGHRLPPKGSNHFPATIECTKLHPSFFLISSQHIPFLLVQFTISHSAGSTLVGGGGSQAGGGRVKTGQVGWGGMGGGKQGTTARYSKYNSNQLVPKTVGKVAKGLRTCRTRKRSPFLTGRYASKKYGFRYTSNRLPVTLQPPQQKASTESTKSRISFWGRDGFVWIGATAKSERSAPEQTKQDAHRWRGKESVKEAATGGTNINNGNKINKNRGQKKMKDSCSRHKSRCTGSPCRRTHKPVSNVTPPTLTFFGVPPPSPGLLAKNYSESESRTISAAVCLYTSFPIGMRMVRHAGGAANRRGSYKNIYYKN